MANSKPLHFWSDDETEFMLYQLRDMNILKYMDGRKTRNGRLFKKVAEQMEDAGFKRSPEQVRVRWKHLKQAYYNTKKNNQTIGCNPVSCTYSEILEELLGNQSTENGVDIGLIPSVSESVLEEEDLEGTVEAESPETVQELDGNSSESSERIYTPQMKNSAPLLERVTSTPLLDLPPLSEETAKRKRRRKSDVELLLHRMQQMQKTWMEQIQLSHEREERLVKSILQSNESVVSALMEGIHSLRSPMSPTSPQGSEDNGNSSHISPLVQHLTSQMDAKENTSVNKQHNNSSSKATQTKVASSDCGVSTLTFPLDSPQLFLYPTIVKQPSKRPRLTHKEKEDGPT